MSEKITAELRTEFGKTHTTEDELLMPAPLQGWVNETLRHAALSIACERRWRDRPR